MYDSVGQLVRVYLWHSQKPVPNHPCSTLILTPGHLGGRELGDQALCPKAKCRLVSTLPGVHRDMAETMEEVEAGSAGADIDININID